LLLFHPGFILLLLQISTAPTRTVFLESTAAAYAFSSREGDPAGAAVIAFYLFAVFMHQTGSGIHHDKFVKWTALVFFILSLFAILKSV
jgi:hypothetical protein